MNDMLSGRPKTPYARKNLRPEAESKLINQPVAESAHAETTEKMLHELQVHQIELEMQNEQLRQAHLALEESRDRYLDLFKFAPVGYFTLTATGLIAEVNFVGAALLGVKRKKLLLRPFSRYVASECCDQFHLQISRLIHQDEQQRYDLQIKCENGESHYVHVDAARVKTEDGKITLRITLTDITDNKRVEDALRKTTDYLDKLIEHANGPIAVWDASYRITKVNRAVENLTGLKASEIMSQPIDMLFTANDGDSEDVMTKIQLTMQGEHWESLEIPMRHKSGAIRVISWNFATLYLDDGKTVRAIIAQGQDITQRKLSDTDLRIAATAFEAQEAIMVADAQRIIIRVNTAFTFLTGYNAEEAIGQPGSLLRSERHDAAFFQELWETSERNHYWQGEIWTKRKNGEEFPAWLTITSVFGDDGSIANYVGTFMDISLQKQAEKVLLDARKRLEKQVEKTVTELAQLKEETGELNTALKVMIKLRQTENSDAKNMLILELKQEVMPFLQRLKNGNHDTKQIRLISTLDANLQRLVSSYGCSTTITSSYKSLTPKEIQVASMVREGFSTKVIAATLSLSPETISIHRKNIRKKLGLDSKADNLRSHLITFEK